MKNKVTDFNYGNEWVQDNTLGGGSAKSFRWKLDEANNLHISRIFKDKDKQRRVDLKLSAAQLDRIADYVKEKGSVCLANSVSKLPDGSEKEGLGRFMFESFKLTNTSAQTSSHVAALFVQAGIWQVERKGGMQFKANKVFWKEYLRNYYNRGTNTVIN